MSRSKLPESTADRIAVSFTFATIVAAVWLIAAAPQESPGDAFAAAGTPSAPHVDARSAGASSVVADQIPAQLRSAETPVAESIATF